MANKEALSYIINLYRKTNKQAELIKLYRQMLEWTPPKEVRLIANMHSELAQIYWELFKVRPDIEVIMHGHDPLILEYADELSKKPGVALTERFAEYGTPEFKGEIIRALQKQKDTNFVIARDHGFFSLGKTFNEAGNRALKYNREALYRRR